MDKQSNSLKKETITVSYYAAYNKFIFNNLSYMCENILKIVIWGD